MMRPPAKKPIMRSGFPHLDAFFVRKISDVFIYGELNKAGSIEEQFILLRNLTALTAQDLDQRRSVIAQLLDWICRKTGEMFEAVAFGSSVNGLGFQDSDLDLKLCPIVLDKTGIQPRNSITDVHILKLLSRINYAIRGQAPVATILVKSKRCPITKLEFKPETKQFKPAFKLNPSLQGIKVDISISACDNLASYNSEFTRFLCELEPKFQLLALAVRRWSQAHDLIVPGKMSSYALTNLLIYFCQTQSLPLLPTVDYMRDIDPSLTPRYYKGWNYATCQRLEMYEQSKNDEPLLLLLVRFFEMLLKFPYSTHIITSRPGRALTKVEFKTSPYFCDELDVTHLINIQDPFDIGHNLTRGMTLPYFEEFQYVVRATYERACYQFTKLLDEGISIDLLRSQPSCSVNSDQDLTNSLSNWGLTALFEPLKFEPISLTQVLANPLIRQKKQKSKSNDNKGNGNNAASNAKNETTGPTSGGSNIGVTILKNTNCIIQSNYFIIHNNIVNVDEIVYKTLDILSEAANAFVTEVLFSEQVQVTTYPVAPYAARIFSEISFVDKDFESMVKRVELRKFPTMIDAIDELELQRFFKDVISKFRQLEIVENQRPLVVANVKVCIICDWRYPGMPLFNLVVIHDVPKSSTKYGDILENSVFTIMRDFCRRL